MPCVHSEAPDQPVPQLISELDRKGCPPITATNLVQDEDYNQTRLNSRLI